MAACPKCGYRLKLWHIRAECPKCGVNIPNHDWENRLEEDSREAQAAYYRLHLKLSQMQFSLAGSRLRILRVPVGALALLSLLLPAGKILLDLPFAQSEKSLGLLGTFSALFGSELSTATALFSSPAFGTAAQQFAAALGCYLPCVLIPPATLALFLFRYRHPQSRIAAALNFLAGALMLTSAFLLNACVTQLAPFGISGGTSFMVYITAALYFAAGIVDLLAARGKERPDFEAIAQEKSKFRHKK